MARSRMTDRPETPTPSSLAAAPSSKVRIDQPHRPNNSTSLPTSQNSPPPFFNHDDEDQAAAPTIPLGAAEEQVLAQAAQLASILQTRLQSLDRREANLHAATAQFEVESRSIRLALQEREATLLEGEGSFEQKMSEFRERFQTQIEREQRLVDLEEQLQARERQATDEADGLELARRTFQVERDELQQQLQQERSDFQQQMQQEKGDFQQRMEQERSDFQQQRDQDQENFARHMQEERDALLHEIELTRSQDRERAEAQQLELQADFERQRQELFTEREQLEKTQSAFEQERAMWVVARTNGAPDAFDLAQDRMQLEKDRQGFLEERRTFESQRGEWVSELERRQIEIDRLRKSAGPAQPCDWSSGESETAARSSALPAELGPHQPRPHDALSAISQHTTFGDGELPFACLSIDEQRERLEEAADYLAREAEDLDRERQQLTEMQQRFKARMQQQQEELQRRTHAIEQEAENRHTKLATRERQIDQQLTTVEQTRQEIIQVHRESLEMRLVAEELWAQVTGKVPAAEASQAIAKLRNRLASQFKVENQQLVSKKQQILELAERLNEQYEAVLRQRRELQAWGAARQIEIEQQAERLVQREIELDEHQQLLEHYEAEKAREVRRQQLNQQQQTVRAA